jgi:hypothetical protein
MTSTDKTSKGCLTTILEIFGIKTKEPALEKLPYRFRDDFLSPAELSFYRVLKSVVNRKFEVCTKVRLADIFYVTQPNKNFSYFNRISQRHVDFLICQPETMKPIFAIELDDTSHNRADRQESDAFVDQSFKAAGLPLIHIPAQRAYDTRELAARISRFVPESDLSEKSSAAVAHVVEETEITIPACPKCGSVMVLRTVNKGEHQGKQFYGCSTYPKCRGVLPLS